MQFTVSVTGKVRLEVSGTNGIDASELLDEEVGYTSVEFEDAEALVDTVTIEARARLDDHEVSASDLGEFDAEQALDEAIGSYNATVSDADFEVTDSPTGFDTVVEALGYDREQAIAVYAALDAAGLSVE